jgi:hypothetical protein
MNPERDLGTLLERIDAFIDRELAPLEAEHPQFFDHRREFARTDHRRYRLTEGSEEIQIRNIARSLFGFGDRSPGRTADV